MSAAPPPKLNVEPTPRAWLRTLAVRPQRQTPADYQPPVNGRSSPPPVLLQRARPVVSKPASNRGSPARLISISKNTPEPCRTQEEKVVSSPLPPPAFLSLCRWALTSLAASLSLLWPPLSAIAEPGPGTAASTLPSPQNFLQEMKLETQYSPDLKFFIPIGVAMGLAFWITNYVTPYYAIPVTPEKDEEPVSEEERTDSSQPLKDLKDRRGQGFGREDG